MNRQTVRHWLTAAWVACGLAISPIVAAQPATASPPSSPLHAMFEAHWAEQMAQYPEWATMMGEHQHGHRFTDVSPAAQAARFQRTRHWLAQARALPVDGLSARDRTSLRLFIHEQEAELRQEPFEGYRSMSLGSMFGFHGMLPWLMSTTPTETAAQAEQALQRLAAYPARVEQEVANLQRGMALGWVAPREVLQRVLAQLDAQLAAPLERTPFLTAFERLGAQIPPEQQQALRERARSAVREQVWPAQRRLREFVAGPYLAAAPANGALGSYPGGAEVYAERISKHTTTAMSAREIHELGLRELARLHTEMAAVQKELKFEGTLAAFAQHLRTDPRYFAASPDAMLATYRDIAKRLDAEMPALFAELPRAPYGIKAMPDYRGIDSAEYYESPSLDGKRPGWFMANALAYKRRPLWGMETLVAHEAVPGHHLQIARAIELGDLPKFRRGGGYTVYSEGWALYAETLGTQMGLYKEATSRFGHLQSLAFRAARLVVDTGFHALGWSRQRAIDFMVENTGEERSYIEGEVDRYTSWPGQALAYTTGMLKIQALRDSARQQLGERFDLRRFHMAVLDQGAVPLPVLEEQVQAWVQAELARKP